METGQAAIVDVETTGISRKDEIVEIAILLFTFDKETGNFLSRDDYYQGYQEPVFEIEPEATAVHGLTKETLKGKTIDHGRVKELFQKSEFLVAHNAVFDRRFIFYAYPAFRNKEWHCSMRSINWIVTGCENKQLQTILAHHGIIPTRAHSAYDDVARLYELLAKIEKKSGKPYFAAVMNALPVRTKTEMARGLQAEEYLCGTYVDEFEEWVASYLRSDLKTRQRKWNSLSPEQQDYFSDEYGIREQESLFS